MPVTVHYNKLPIAPRKLRAVLHVLRDRTVPEAIALMEASPRTTTEPIIKLLKASISAAHDLQPALRPAELRVAEAYCNEATRIYRTRLRGRGRSSRMAKRGSHLTLTVVWSGNQTSHVRSRNARIRNPKFEIPNPKPAKQTASTPKPRAERQDMRRKKG